MANPPIVIGPFDNVPAPGSPIRSDWPQEISTVVTANQAAIARQAYIVKQGGTEYTGHLMILGGVVVVTTDASGNFTVGYAPRVFAGANPLVFAGVHSASLPFVCNVSGGNVTGFSGHIVNETGGLVQNYTLEVNWHAIGVSAV